VDPLGRDFERTELDVEAVRTRDLPVVTRRTVYDRVGNVVAWAAIATLGAGALLGWRRAR
jgi:apolipoprotein N-acyltransferase